MDNNEPIRKNNTGFSPSLKLLMILVSVLPFITDVWIELNTPSKRKNDVDENNTYAVLFSSINPVVFNKATITTFNAAVTNPVKKWLIEISIKYAFQ